MAILPGLCFFASGIFNMELSVSTMGVTQELLLNPLSLSVTYIQVIAASSIGEFYLYYKNLETLSKEDPNDPFYKKLLHRSKVSYSIVLKKKCVDPIQDVIITENVLAVLGVTIPIFTSLICYSTGIGSIDLFGQFLNGSIQVYLGYLINRQNYELLIGKSLNKKDTEILIDILQSREEIIGVESVKTELTNDLLKISAPLHYDSDKMGENVIKVLEQDVLKISEDKIKQEKIFKLLKKSTELYFTQTAQSVRTMEENIKKSYPDIVEIDLEKSASNISKDFEGLIVSRHKNPAKDTKNFIK
jgi:divalent metal cation (Fe/Co/Zn/Cd) transporter